MVLGHSVERIVKLIGHDGSEILWPHLGEPERRTAFHIEEIQYAARSLGFAFICYVPAFMYQPIRGNLNSVVDVRKFDKQFPEVLLSMDGILLGQGKAGTDHAVAWNHKEGLIYDPNGTIYDAQGFVPEAFHGITRLPS